jgi:hypothetical protein
MNRENYERINAEASMDQVWAACESHLEDIERIAMNGPSQEGDENLMLACCCFVAAHIGMMIKAREESPQDTNG